VKDIVVFGNPFGEPAKGGTAYRGVTHLDGPTRTGGPSSIAFSLDSQWQARGPNGNNRKAGCAGQHDRTRNCRSNLTYNSTAAILTTDLRPTLARFAILAVSVSAIRSAISEPSIDLHRQKILYCGIQIHINLRCPDTDDQRIPSHLVVSFQRLTRFPPTCGWVDRDGTATCELGCSTSPDVAVQRTKVTSPSS